MAMASVWHLHQLAKYTVQLKHNVALAVYLTF